MQVERTRTISAQTRLDARDLCLLVEAYPETGQMNASAVMRFYLESATKALIKHGRSRPVKIDEAIARLEARGFPLKQLDMTNPEARRTMLAVEKQNLQEMLGDDIVEDATAPQIADREINEMAALAKQMMEQST